MEGYGSLASPNGGRCLFFFQLASKQADNKASKPNSQLNSDDKRACSLLVSLRKPLKEGGSSKMDVRAERLPKREQNE